MKRRSFLPAPKSYRPVSAPEPIITDDTLPNWHDKIGQQVCISGAKYGILRYFGYTKFADGVWCGIELLEPIGKNNGCVEGVRYFFCKENYGIFAPVFKVELAKQQTHSSHFSPHPTRDYCPLDIKSSKSEFKSPEEEFTIRQSKLKTPKIKSYKESQECSQVSRLPKMTKDYSQGMNERNRIFDKKYVERSAIPSSYDVTIPFTSDEDISVRQTKDFTISFPRSIPDLLPPNAYINQSEDESFRQLEEQAMGGSSEELISDKELERYTNFYKNRIEILDQLEPSDRIDLVGKEENYEQLNLYNENNEFIESSKDIPLEKEEGNIIDEDILDIENQITESEEIKEDDKSSLYDESVSIVLTNDTVSDKERPLSLVTMSSGDTGFQDTQNEFDLPNSNSPDECLPKYLTESDSDIGSETSTLEPAKGRNARVIDGKLYYAESHLEEAEIISNIPNREEIEKEKTDENNESLQQSIPEKTKIEIVETKPIKKDELKKSKETHNKKQTKNKKCEVKPDPIKVRKPSPERPWRTPPKIIDKKEKEIEKVDSPKKEKRQMPKKNVMSKIKAMIEATSCKSGTKDEESDIDTKKPRQLKKSRWDDVTSKIEASLAKEKHKAKKSEVKSKINTNLTAMKNKQEITNCLDDKNEILKSLDSQIILSNINDSCETLNKAEDDVDFYINTASPQSGRKNRDRLLEKKSPREKSPSQGSVDSNRSSMKESKSATLAEPNTKQDAKRVTREPIAKSLVQQNNKRNVLMNVKSSIKTESSRSAIKIAVNKPLNTRTSIKSSDVASPPRTASPRNSLLKMTIGTADKKPLKQDQNRLRSLRPTAGLVKSGHSKPDLLATSPASTHSTKEICRLEALCESRTKELNYLKMQMKGTVSAFDAMTVLLQYLTEELDAFSVPELKDNLKQMKDELKQKKREVDDVKSHAESDLALITDRHNSQLEQIEADQKQELTSLKDALTRLHQEELENIKSTYTEEYHQLEEKQKEEVAHLIDIHQKALKDIRSTNQMLLDDMKKQCDHQRKELLRNHKQQLQDLTTNYQDECRTLQQQITELMEQRQALEERAKTFEDAIQRDADVKVQVALARCRDLQSEVDSLKMVLDMRKKELDEVRTQNRELQKELEELPVARERIRKLEAKVEDLKAMMDIRVKSERQLSREHTFLKESFIHESKTNKRLSMENEELQWRLRHGLKTTTELVRRRSWTEDSYDNDGLAFVVPLHSNDSRLSELSKFESLPRRKKHSELPVRCDRSFSMSKVDQLDTSLNKKDKKPPDVLCSTKSPEPRKKSVSNNKGRSKSALKSRPRVRAVSEPSPVSDNQEMDQHLIADTCETSSKVVDESTSEPISSCLMPAQVNDNIFLAEQLQDSVERILSEETEDQSNALASQRTTENLNPSDLMAYSLLTESSISQSTDLEQNDETEPGIGELENEEQLRAIGLIQLTDSFSEDRSDTCSNDQQLSWDYAPLSDSYQSNDSQSLDHGLEFDHGECSSRGVATPVRECLSFHSEVVQQAMHLAPQTDSESEEEQKLQVTMLEKDFDMSPSLPSADFMKISLEFSDVDIIEKRTMEMTDSGVAFQEMTDSGLTLSGITFSKKECQMTDSGVALHEEEDQVKLPLKPQLSSEFPEAPADTYL